ncbi:MAG: hypothetical protein WAW69_04400 [Polaromonas sp.]
MVNCQELLQGLPLYQPRANALAKLRDGYGAIEPWWKSEFGHGFDGLTESEDRYITRSGLPADTFEAFLKGAVNSTFNSTRDVSNAGTAIPMTDEPFVVWD